MVYLQAQAKLLSPKLCRLMFNVICSRPVCWLYAFVTKRQTTNEPHSIHPALNQSLNGTACLLRVFNELTA
jgi:hypothetical protein